MRLSEILSIEENCLERLPPDDGSDECLLYVRGVLVKTAGTPSGELVRWVAGVDGPDNHVRAAIELVRRLTGGLRKGTGGTHLFLTIALREGKRRPDSPGGQTINWCLNTYARAVGTARPWRFSSHQFRKTFARFVALGDKSGLLALKQHANLETDARQAEDALLDNWMRSAETANTKMDGPEASVSRRVATQETSRNNSEDAPQ
jgi:hypothetical protein